MLGNAKESKKSGPGCLKLDTQNKWKAFNATVAQFPIFKMGTLVQHPQPQQECFGNKIINVCEVLAHTRTVGVKLSGRWATN